MGMIRRNFNNRRQPPPGKVYRHFHSPTTVEDGNLKAAISEDGRVTITENHENDEYDEVNVPASFVFTIANMLTTTKKTKLINKEDIPK